MSSSTAVFEASLEDMIGGSILDDEDVDDDKKVSQEDEDDED